MLVLRRLRYGNGHTREVPPLRYEQGKSLPMRLYNTTEEIARLPLRLQCMCSEPANGVWSKSSADLVVPLFLYRGDSGRLVTLSFEFFDEVQRGMSG